MAELYRYAAFISYSSKDSAFARRLHRAMESYSIPVSLGKFDLTVGGGKQNRIYPVFRDREELSAGQLGEQIEANLKASASLIVVCSPRSAQSPWVQKEIEFFAALGRHSKIFAIIPDTAPLVDAQGADATQSCFPGSFRGDALAGDKLEPLAADARKGKDGFRTALLKIVAGLVGVSPGQIIDRDKRRRRQQRIGLTVALACVMAAVVYGAVWIDARAWRTSAAFEAQSLAKAGRVLDATPLALAATAPEGALVFPDGAGIEAAYALLPAVKFDLGSLEQLPDFSPDGKWLSGLKTNSTWFVMSTETGETFDVAFGDQPEYSDDGARLTGWTAGGEGLSFDLASRTYTSLGQLACPPVFVLGGSKTFLNLADGRSFLLDPLGDRVEVPPADCDSTRSPGGGYIAMSQINALAPTILDTRTGMWRVWTELQGWPEFSGDDAWLVDVRPSGTRAVFNVASGKKSDVLGERETEVGAHILSPGGASLAWRRRQSWFAADMSGGQTHEIGHNLLEPPQFSEDGSVIAALRTDESVVIVDLRSGARTELGPVWYSGTSWALLFSSDGSRVAFRDPSGAGTVLDLADGQRQTFEGRLPYLQFSSDGSWLIARGLDEQYFLQNLETRETQSLGMTRWATFTPEGRSLVLMDDFDDAYLRDIAAFQWPGETVKDRATGLCERDTANPQIRALRPAFRRTPTEAVGSDETATLNAALSAQLVGRPWNVCDWRGLGSVLPDPESGEGWFEGARQWWRLFSVRHLGGDDYACGETLSNAGPDLQTMRRRNCTRVSQDEAAAPSDL